MAAKAKAVSSSRRRQANFQDKPAFFMPSGLLGVSLIKRVLFWGGGRDGNVMGKKIICLILLGWRRRSQARLRMSENILECV